MVALLWRAQEQHGWLPKPAIELVAQMLAMPVIRVYEIATFYTMFNLAPVGEHFVQVCGTTPCMLRGAEQLKKVCHHKIGAEGQVTADGKFSWAEVECVGACVNAPVVQIGADYYEDLTPESLEKLLDDLAAGRTPKSGPQIDRQFAAPVGGPTTLQDLPFAPAAAVLEAEAPVSDEHKPTLLTEARAGQPDDLKLIWGVGPKLEEMLHKMGVFHFDQVAVWTEMNLKWVDQNLGAFRGRAVRDKWIEQAQKLATGWRPQHAAGDKPAGE